VKLLCNDGVVRRFQTSFNDGDRLPNGNRAQIDMEAFCEECGEEFGVHDLAILKPEFKTHICKKIDFLVTI
jgi:hypothetical protein